MSDNDELAALKARVAELERAAKPPEPFKPDPDWQPINPIDRVSMPVSVMQEMANAVPDHVVKGIALRDCRAPTGPSSAGAIPSSQQVSSVRGTGWVHEVPLGPSPHQRYVDAQLDAQAAKDRAALIEQRARIQAMETHHNSLVERRWTTPSCSPGTSSNTPLRARPLAQAPTSIKGSGGSGMEHFTRRLLSNE